MMNDTRDTDETARSVFAGLVPHTSESDAHRERNRIARGVKHTVPILLVGSMAATMLNVTGPIESAHAKRPPKPQADTSDLGKLMRQTMAGTAQSAAAVSVAPAAAPATYRVQAGDTVSDIAGRFGLSTASVLALNGLGWSSLIHPGQELKLSSAGSAPVDVQPETTGGQYTIVAGDTISAIADRFGVSTFSVLAANGLGWSTIIYPGQSIVIPGVPDPDPTVEEAPIVAPEAPVEEAPEALGDPIITVPVAEVAPIVEPPPAPAPVSGSYTILPGDTISGIAAKFGITSQALLDANGLTASSVIYAGHTLVIPGATAPVPAPAANDGSIAYLNDEMRANAVTIVQVGRELGVSDYGIVIALATAMQESTLRNLTWGDLDSVGLFQQRPSSGWGTVEELTNARHATYTFFHGRAGYTRGLLDIPGWESMPLTVAAQAVQISAYPDAYAKWEASARAWLAELS